jgi:hypothetical protein
MVFPLPIAPACNIAGHYPAALVVEPEDVAALAVHIMTNSARTGATFDVDGGEQVLGKE